MQAFSSEEKSLPGIAVPRCVYPAIALGVLKFILC
jgi:hypothetical protein